eukprot:TRINITY_DN114558_c0_g1_i1.p1 TRINITY_DN114558_c0_g1~~TRINITY_DN114558_c0_g1_i1.p1  ORF type:complete len:221 (+),score=32.53 TRINITY_DN114558_c0_g1_i1:105-767(+)
MARSLAAVLAVISAAASEEEALAFQNESVAEGETATPGGSVDKSSRNATLTGFGVEEYVMGGLLGLTWEDCGTKEEAATILGFTPDQLTLGANATLKGWGDLRMPVEGGTVNIHTRAGFISDNSQADLCNPKTNDMPLNAGSVTWHGLECPVAAGPITILTDLMLSESLPRFLLRATVTIEGTASSGEPLFCLELKISPSRRLATKSSDDKGAEVPTFVV